MLIKSLSIPISLFVLLFGGVRGCSNYEDIPRKAEDIEVISKDSWQSKLDNSTLVSSLAIPGTHDTGAYMSGGALAITQNLPIKEQLTEGVRAFDIRLGAVDNEKLVVYHGIISQRLTFKQDILEACVDFLKQHPREFIIMSLKRERDDSSSSKGYNSLIREIVEKSSYKDYFVKDFKKNITVEELRGKILLLHRSYLGKPILGGAFSGWKDNASFKGDIIGDSSVADMFVEDEYKVSSLFHINNKWEAIKKNLEKSNNDTNLENWYITFTSGTSIFAYPKTVARKINPKVLDLFSNQESKKYRGIIFMDFVEKDDITTKSIIDTNFN